MTVRRRKPGTDWSRATDRMPASFADQPRRDTPVEGRRNDDGLDLVEAVAAATAPGAIAELATGNVAEPVREDAVGLGEDDVLSAETEDAEQAAPDDEDDEED